MWYQLDWCKSSDSFRPWYVFPYELLNWTEFIPIIKIGTQRLTSRPWHESGVMVRKRNVSKVRPITLYIFTSCIGFVYRFISKGTIEEKIFQRQASKQALSSAVVDATEDAERHFSVDMLRQLFQFKENTLCETHETFKCKRCKNGRQTIKSQALLYGDASTYVVSSLPN